MAREWNVLTDDAQLHLAREALARAADMIAHQAEYLASEIDCGVLADHGGADALRLLAAIIRRDGDPAGSEPVGRA